MSDQYRRGAATKTYKVRVQNNMHGYQSNRVISVEAVSEKEALEIAQRKDVYADVRIEKGEQ